MNICAKTKNFTVPSLVPEIKKVSFLAVWDAAVRHKCIVYRYETSLKLLHLFNSNKTVNKTGTDQFKPECSFTPIDNENNYLEFIINYSS